MSHNSQVVFHIPYLVVEHGPDSVFPEIRFITGVLDIIWKKGSRQHHHMPYVVHYVPYVPVGDNPG